MAVLLPGVPARAAVIWSGDAGRGSASATFGQDNCDAPGTVAAATDAVRGPVWRFTKPAGDNRCEEHGIKVGGSMYHFTNNATYYLSWSTRLSSTVDNNAIFQWKSYGNHIQNYPVVIKVLHGKLTMLNRQPGPVDHYPWAVPVSAGTWYHLVLGIHTSDQLQGGWVELYLDGVAQHFTDGGTRWPARTWDSSNDPKWGVYGAEGSTVVNDVDDLRLGTTYADVGATTASPSARPSAKPSASASPAEPDPDGPSPSDPAPVPAAATGRPGHGGPYLAVAVLVLAVAAIAGGLVLRRRGRGPRHRVSART